MNKTYNINKILIIMVLYFKIVYNLLFISSSYFLLFFFSFCCRMNRRNKNKDLKNSLIIKNERNDINNNALRPLYSESLHIPMSKYSY